jgi:pSer/pThr/pTyr-binding forkhead associated (FHA) protein
MADLIIQSGKHQGKRLAIPASTIIIGRDETCRVRLASSDVSRQHCALRSTPEGIMVRDLGSRNGTLVNDVAIDRDTLLKPGDMLRVGPMLFSVPAVVAEPPVKVARPAQTKRATDDDIASWLSGEEEDAMGEGTTSTGETTIITNLPPKSSPPPRDFKSVAEEAAWIIKKHREQQANK